MSKKSNIFTFLFLFLIFTTTILFSIIEIWSFTNLVTYRILTPARTIVFIIQIIAYLAIVVMAIMTLIYKIKWNFDKATFYMYLSLIALSFARLTYHLYLGVNNVPANSLISVLTIGFDLFAIILFVTKLFKKECCNKIKYPDFFGAIFLSFGAFVNLFLMTTPIASGLEVIDLIAEILIIATMVVLGILTTLKEPDYYPSTVSQEVENKEENSNDSSI